MNVSSAYASFPVVYSTTVFSLIAEWGAPGVMMFL